MDDDLHQLTMLLVFHQRSSDDGRCVCGHQGRLGEVFYRHVAEIVTAAGWRRTAK